MNTDSLNNLVEGWSFDKATGEFVLGETKDYWSFEDGFLVRNHVWSRNSTFTSEEAPLPAAAEELQSTTGLTLPNGSRQVFVNNKETYSIGKDQWVGKTLFPLTKEAAQSRHLPYAGDLKDKLNTRWTLRCRGHIWAAVTAPKKKPTPSNVGEKKLSWEDRLAFVEGKKVNSARCSRMVFGRWNYIHTMSLQIAYFEQDGFSLGAQEQEVNNEQKHASSSKGSMTLIFLKESWKPAVPLCAEQLAKLCWPSHAMKIGKSG